MKKIIVLILIISLSTQILFSELIRDNQSKITVDSYKIENNKLKLVVKVNIDKANKLGKIKIGYKYKVKGKEWETGNNIYMEDEFIEGGIHELIWDYKRDIGESDLEKTEIEFYPYTYSIPDTIKNPVIYILYEQNPSGLKINEQEDFLITEQGETNIKISKDGYRGIEKEIQGERNKIYKLSANLIPSKPKGRYKNTSGNITIIIIGGMLGGSVIAAIIGLDPDDSSFTLPALGLVALTSLTIYLGILLYESIKYGKEDAKALKAMKQWESEYGNKKSEIKIMKIE